jgi:hypothetical protein
LPPTVLDGALDDAPAENWRFAPGEAIFEGLGFEFLQLSVPDGRVEDWRGTGRLPLAVSAVSSFVPV